MNNRQTPFELPRLVTSSGKVRTNRSKGCLSPRHWDVSFSLGTPLTYLARTLSLCVDPRRGSKCVGRYHGRSCHTFISLDVPLSVGLLV